MEQRLHHYHRPLFGSNNGSAFEFSRHFELEFGPFRAIFGLSCDDVELGERTEGREGFATEAEGLEGREVIVGGELRSVVLQGCGSQQCASTLQWCWDVHTDSFVVGWGDSRAVVLDFNGVETIVLEPNLCESCQTSQTFHNGKGVGTYR